MDEWMDLNFKSLLSTLEPRWAIRKKWSHLTYWLESKQTSSLAHFILPLTTTSRVVGLVTCCCRKKGRKVELLSYFIDSSSVWTNVRQNACQPVGLVIYSSILSFKKNKQAKKRTNIESGQRQQQSKDNQEDVNKTMRANELSTLARYYSLKRRHFVRSFDVGGISLADDQLDGWLRFDFLLKTFSRLELHANRNGERRECLSSDDQEEEEEWWLMVCLSLFLFFSIQSSSSKSTVTFGQVRIRIVSMVR